MSDVQGWLDTFSHAINTGDGAAVAALFLPDGLWRDHVAFGWTLATHEGAGAIAAFAAARGAATGTSNWLSEAEVGASEGYISFETALGRGKGYLRLVGEGDDSRALTFYTMLAELKGFEEPLGTRRVSGMAEDPEGRGRSWKQLLEDEAAGYGADKNPYVLVIGAGQSGLALGARLRMLGVPCLMVDKYPRIGDQWRSRYSSLTLHDPVWYDHLPYVPYPAHWPVYTPKDKMGDWLEYYAGIMELPVWSSTECVSAAYNPAHARWDVTLKRDSGEIVLHPEHLIMAMGNAGFAKMPPIPGQDDFTGTLCHSSAHPGGEGLAGKRVIVIGANNSAHDIAADLVLHGAQPVMIQRSSTHIVRQTTMTDVMLKPIYSQEALEAGMTTERADIMVASVPLRLSEKGAKATWDALQVSEAPFYDRLTKAGFAVDFGEDGTGIAMNFLRTSSGYYLDVGASEMVADGRIAVRSGTAIERIVEDGLVMADGSHERADAIICATGFGTMAEWTARLISPEVASQVGPCWGYGSGTRGDPGPWEGEIRNMWKPTAVPGLWFMGGNFALGRHYSRLLGLQLKARYEGLAAEPYAAA